MDNRGPKDEQGLNSDWTTMQSLPPHQPRENKAMHAEPRADTLPTKENAPYNIKAEVTFAGDQILRKHGMASHLMNTLKQQHLLLEGTHNPGYMEDQTTSPSLSGFYLDNIKESKTHDSQGVTRSNTAVARESLPPLLILSEEIPLDPTGKGPVKIANKVLGNVFALITIPFTCLILALHHLLRFILQGVVRPLVFDSLRLIIGNTLQPLLTEVVKPALEVMRDGAVSLSDFFMELARPGFALMRSIRVAESHITNTFPVQVI